MTDRWYTNADPPDFMPTMGFSYDDPRKVLHFIEHMRHMATAADWLSFIKSAMWAAWLQGTQDQSDADRMQVRRVIGILATAADQEDAAGLFDLCKTARSELEGPPKAVMDLMREAGATYMGPSK